MTRDSWAIGDIAITIIQYNISNKTRATETEILKAVGSMVGKASRTIREYISVSQFYKEADRLEYEALTYGHFRLAIKTNDPLGALEWAVSEVTRTGKPATIDAMLLHCQTTPVENGDQATPVDKLLAFSGAFRDFVDSNRDRLPQPLIERVWKITESIDKIVREVAEMVEKSYTN
jgi:hypothetical protein